MVLAAVALLGSAVPVVAGSYGERRSASAHDGGRAPVKDCTRIVGRYGFYGNPWCSPAEQRAFDRWETRRRR